MKTIYLAAICFAAAGCALYQPPLVTPALARSNRQQHVDVATLERGRVLLANRCIQCHTLPSVWYYTREDWPRIVDSMAHRAALRPNERDAIVAYVCAVRSQP